MSHRFSTYLRPLVGVVTLLLFLIGSSDATLSAQNLNDKLMNRPYADLRRWHLGFSVGLHTQDLSFTHNGLTTEAGEQWFVEQPAFQPGFCVNGLIDYRLGTYFNLRFTPGMYFGTRDITMRDYNSGNEHRQNLKSALIVLPVDLKFSSLRYRNSRPYLTAGIMPTVNVAKQPADYLRTKRSDLFLTCGFGCDFYLPYFKFNPEIKFCFGLGDCLVHDRPDISEEPEKLVITQSLTKAVSRMVVLTFYFE